MPVGLGNGSTIGEAWHNRDMVLTAASVSASQPVAVPTLDIYDEVVDALETVEADVTAAAVVDEPVGCCNARNRGGVDREVDDSTEEGGAMLL